VYKRVLEMTAESYSVVCSNFDGLLIMDYTWTQKNRENLYTKSRYIRGNHTGNKLRPYGKYTGNFYCTEKSE